MQTAPVTILVPALISHAIDERSLIGTVSEAPADLGATVRPVVQFAAACGVDRGGLEADLRRACPAPIDPLFVEGALGKWGALRLGFRAGIDDEWTAVVDGDGAYDLSALAEAIGHGERRGCDLLMGERREILLDPTAKARARAHLEPVVNALLRDRLAAAGHRLPASLRDMQSGFFLCRSKLLAEFFTLERMDEALPDTEPSPLPWSHYGGELHLLAWAAAHRLHVEACPVFVRYGRESGLTVEGIGEMLRASRLFRDVTVAEIEAVLPRVAGALRWNPEQEGLARRAASAAFDLDG